MDDADGGAEVGANGDANVEVEVGRRVAYWRRRRRMSQQVLADRLGKSKSWVDKVERGARRLDKCSVVREVAEVLQVEVRVLLGPEPPGRADGGAVRVDVEGIRYGLECYLSTAAFFQRSPLQRCLPEADKAVGHAWLTFQRADYKALSRVLPRLLHAGQAGCGTNDGTAQQRNAAADVLGQIYQLTSLTLCKLDEGALAWVAADRAVAQTVHRRDPLVIGRAKTMVAHSLLARGRPRTALELSLHTAGQLACDRDDTPPPQRLSVYGTLLLNAALAAAHLGDNATVRELIDGADAAAAEVGGDFNHHWTCFGPTNVQLHKAAAAVHLGEGGAAIDIHSSLDATRFAALPAERRADHYLNIVRAYIQIGEPHTAAQLLLEADRAAASEIRDRPAGHKVLAEVLRHTRTNPSTPIRSLAEQLCIVV